jgi:hypothetical protein
MKSKLGACGSATRFLDLGDELTLRISELVCQPQGLNCFLFLNSVTRWKVQQPKPSLPANPEGIVFFMTKRGANLQTRMTLVCKPTKRMFRSSQLQQG